MKIDSVACRERLNSCMVLFSSLSLLQIFVSCDMHRSLKFCVNDVWLMRCSLGAFHYRVASFPGPAYFPSLVVCMVMQATKIWTGPWNMATVLELHME